MEKLNIGIRMAIEGSTQRDTNQHSLHHSRSASAHGILALLVLVFTVSSCSWVDVGTITLHFKPIDDLSAVRTDLPMYFDASPSMDIDILQRELDAHLSLHKWVRTTAVPQQGIFCKVLMEQAPRSPLIWVWAAVSVLSLTVIPYYDHDGDRTTVSYELYVDGERQKSYEYQITLRELSWLGAPLVKPFLPANWNFLDTATKNQAVINTTRAFLVDAHRDGFL